MSKKKPELSWSALFLGTLLISYLFIFNEWLFAVTKPSYLNNLGILHRLEILLATAALLVSLCFLCLVPLGILSLVSPFRKYGDLLVRLGILLPAAVAATLVLFLVDNFTYTVFRVGIVSTEGWTRGAYGLGFIGVILLCYWRMLHILGRLGRRIIDLGLSPKWVIGLVAAVPLLSMAFLMSPYLTRASSTPVASGSETGQHPHILMITIDGVDSTHTSVYGYELDVIQQAWDSGTVEGSTSACPPEAEITDDQAFQWLVDHLRENGFDVSSLDEFPDNID